ncbi:Fic/DOC family protein [Deinococcus taklimakanensis]|uniref:protein adenylyltransferase n=1 Tax=Deinococcus taklimakanensis TaxID=536443 RepID=A0ABW5P7E7_9DEIO
MARPFEFFAYDNGVPKNRLGLDDAQALSLIERDLTHTRILQLHAGISPEATRGNFDLEHLKAIHQHIFQDVYDWAGLTRNQELTVHGEQVEPPATIFKDDGRIPRAFVPSRMVDQSLVDTFAELKRDSYLQGLTRDAFADRAAITFARINDAHPFMEGNGRTQREFMTQLAARAGHELNFDVVSGERMAIVSHEARAGDVSGMQRLFREIGDPERVHVLQEGQTHLERLNFDWHRVYVATVTPGREYSGQVAVTSPEVVVLRCDGEILMAQTRNFEWQPEPRELVTFRAFEYDRPEEWRHGEGGRQRDIDLEL